MLVVRLWPREALDEALRPEDPRWAGDHGADPGAALTARARHHGAGGREALAGVPGEPRAAGRRGCLPTEHRRLGVARASRRDLGPPRRPTRPGRLRRRR